eukprot:TRINITY_DN107_c0_g2_i1.p1 TRINITY_DN107_c0_g2~~TRINITY_DN107_c0_g2_i1.p1  ORF type:complete len:325 (+),score=28.10 TRINITY_DN107_c0_g2_i1:406-1380(+)
MSAQAVRSRFCGAFSSLIRQSTQLTHQHQHQRHYCCHGQQHLTSLVPRTHIRRTRAFSTTPFTTPLSCFVHSTLLGRRLTSANTQTTVVGRTIPQRHPTSWHQGASGRTMSSKASEDGSVCAAEDTAQVLHKAPLETAKAKWVSLQQLKWKDEDGRERLWECAERKTRGTSCCDAVSIFTILKGSKTQTSTLLVRQFRPPLGAYTVEFPAGLVDDNEPPRDSALRELKEETGYVGTVQSVSPVVCADPGMSTANMRMVTVSVDCDSSENLNPQACPEPGEHITVFKVPVSELHARLDRFLADGDAVDSRLYHFAVGLNLNVASL